MASIRIDTLIVGGGQAGLAMSEHLGKHGISHVILEKDRLVERWRTARWDGLVANGPAWHDSFPTFDFAEVGVGPDVFASKASVVDYFESFARQIDAPCRCGVEVTRVHQTDGERGFYIQTTDGDYHAMHVVCATGPFQTPVVPPIVPADAPVTQMHSNQYRNPDQLAGGAVLVVGSGSSGSQIADELLRAGRSAYLSVGPHDRPPRSYRGRDFVWWLGVLGLWDLATPAPDTAHVTIAVSGAHGGYTVDFREYAERGMKLVGMTKAYADGNLTFETDLASNIKNGDANYLALLDEADAYVRRNGIDLPEEPEARVVRDDPSCVREPLLSLDLAASDINTIIWATGYSNDFSWLEFDVFDKDGKPSHSRGVSSVPGIYFLGLPWLSRRGSSFIWGVWHDARFLADHIATQNRYIDYHHSKNT